MADDHHPLKIEAPAPGGLWSKALIPDPDGHAFEPDDAREP